VKISNDPNDRHNPRALDTAHVEALAQAFSTVGGKQDRDTPIYLRCDPSLIEPDCLADMRRGEDPDLSRAGLAFAPPALRLLKGPEGKKERDLELEDWFQRDLKTREYLDEATVVDKRTELNRMREAGPRATLLNGNHRINGMLSASSVIREEHDAIIALDREGLISAEDLEARLLTVRELVRGSTYCCEVFKGEDRPRLYFEYIFRPL
jgi:hypothetical protein